MRKIEEIIKELAKNLRSKLLNGDYKIIKIEKYDNRIESEGFVFNLYCDVSYPEISFGICASSVIGSSFHNSDIEKIFDLGSETLRMDAWRIWKKKEKEYMEVQGKRNKQKKINRLRKELKELEEK